LRYRHFADQPRTVLAGCSKDLALFVAPTSAGDRGASCGLLNPVRRRSRPPNRAFQRKKVIDSETIGLTNGAWSSPARLNVVVTAAQRSGQSQTKVRRLVDIRLCAVPPPDELLALYTLRFNELRGIGTLETVSDTSLLISSSSDRAAAATAPSA
jgi:hypothetical protein